MSPGPPQRHHEIKTLLKKNFFSSFIYFWRQRMSEGGAEKARETQNQKPTPSSELSAQSPTPGSNS